MKTMKKTIALLTTLVLFVGSVQFVQAQEDSTETARKIGHINSNELLQLMPERDQVQKELEEYQKQLQTQLQTMSTEYESKVADYQTNEKTWTDLVKRTKVREISEMEGRIQEFRQGAEQDLQQKEQMLVQPLLDKAEKAIKTVATENGYDYVLDTSAGLVLHFPEGDNILPLVKSHLQIP